MCQHLANFSLYHLLTFGLVPFRAISRRRQQIMVTPFALAGRV